MLTVLGIVACGIAVGILIGLTGMGGILIPPLMIFLLGMDTHLAMGTSMASFLPPCMLAIWSHVRRGNIHWPAVVPISVAGVVCVFWGTELKAYSSGDALNLLLAVLIIVVGGIAFRPVSIPWASVGERRSAWIRPGVRLALLGGAVGVISGMTGAGGSVLTVPAMIAMGYHPLASIATGMVYVTLVCAAGTVGNVLHNTVDFSLAALCAVGQVIGVWAGLAAARFLQADTLGKVVAWVCVLTGSGILFKTLLGWIQRVLVMATLAPNSYSLCFSPWLTQSTPGL